MQISTDVAIGVAAAIAVRWAQASPKVSWLTPERTKTMQAILVIFSTLVGIAHASQTPGDLAKLDWTVTLQSVFDAGAIVWLAAMSVLPQTKVPPATAAPLEPPPQS